ncbi:MAG: hypothetical protein U0172_06510 [Nitrospiraceae bacterium]
MTHSRSSTQLCIVFLGLLLPWGLDASPALAQAPEDSHVTTERFCSFMMAKGEASQECEVPMLKGCKVALFPATTTPWTTINRGGRTTCHFDPKRTDWRTRIIGACGKCETEQCSASFHVKLDCAPN